MPQSRAEKILFGLIVMLWFGVMVAWVIDPRLHRDERQQSEQFQGLLRGLGFGPAADLSTCDFAYDARLNESCPWDRGPIPGGAYFCPQHAHSVLPYRQSAWQRGTQLSANDGDAQVP